jgi:adenylosuccinate lyase
MPHKKNPIGPENINGLGRVVRSHLYVAFENVLTWQERDLTHSSAERIYLPENLNLICYMIRKMNNLVNDVKFNTKKMNERIQENYEYLSNYFLHLLIREKKCSRLAAYEMIQHAVKTSSNLDEFVNIVNKFCACKSIGRI